MFLVGGSLKSHPIFKKIISIGFEFETINLIKLSADYSSRNKDQPIKLINSDISIKTLEEKIVNGTANELDKYIELIYDDGKKVLEYFYENDGDEETSSAIKFQITNDISDHAFVKLLRKKCKDIENVPKDDLYYLKIHEGKTHERKIYTLGFTADAETCEQITNVEYVITYYNPDLTRNIIIKEFKDASDRIIEHLRGLTVEKCDFMIKAPDDLKDKTELIEVKANGMGFMLVKREVFDAILDPFEPLDPDQWEDFTFQQKAKNAGFNSYIDPQLIIGHEKKVVL